MTSNHVTLFSGIAIGFTIAFIALGPSAIYEPIKRYSTLREFGPPGDGHDDTESDIEATVVLGHEDSNDTFHKMTNSSLAEQLKEKVRVLCWVMTSPDNHQKKAIHVKATWGKRCNILLFMSSKSDPTLPSVALPVGEGRQNLWAKTKEAFKYIYKHYYDKAEWFLKADDDTYVILENLRYMLLPIDPATPIYYGRRFRPFVKQGYMSGGAGYVLSKDAVRRFVEYALPDPNHCKQEPTGAEDAEIGICLAAVNVTAGDSRDPEGRGRFFPFKPESHLIPGRADSLSWYRQYIYYNETSGMDCCSDNAITFHYIPPDMMYTMEYFIYHLRPFGIAYNPQINHQLLRAAWIKFNNT